MESLLKVKHLTKKLKKFKVDDISFSLYKGRILGFVGENGAGKTTTIKMLLNAIEKTSGDVKFWGMDYQKDEVTIKSRIGYVPAEDYFVARSSLIQHAEAIKIFYENWDEKLFNALCKTWRLPLQRKIYNYSTGMKTKAMLALALAHRPDILILDEPTAGLDPLARIEVLDILQRFVQNGERAVFFSTHIISDLEKIADDIMIMHDGRIIDSFPINKLNEKYALVKGDLIDLEKKQTNFIGINKYEDTFEGVMLRHEAEELFEGKNLYNVTIELLLIHSIRRDRDEESEEIIKSL